MKTMTISEFEKLVSGEGWKRQQEQEIVEQLDRPEEIWDDETESLDLVHIPHAWGWIAKTSLHEKSGIEIVYQEGFNFDVNQPDSLVVGPQDEPDPWEVKGVLVVDEDGDELNSAELADYLTDDFSDLDYSGLAESETSDIDVDEGDDMEAITLEIDNAPDIRFTGELVARTSSSDDQAMGSNYSGQTGRWTELELYKTRGGKYICHQVGRTRWQGERDRHSGKVCESLQEVKEFFGHRWLAKDLYAEAGIDDVVEVD